MKGFWKWFLIVIGVLILIGLIATPFVMHSVTRLGDYPMMPRAYLQNAPSYSGDFNGDFSPRGSFNRMPMHRGFMMPFGGLMMLPFFGLFCLVSLGVLGLAIYGIVALVNRSKAEKVIPPTEVVEVHTQPCVKCGKPVQDDWSTCPHCGQKVRRPK